MTPEDIDRMIAMHDRQRARDQRMAVWFGLAVLSVFVFVVIYVTWPLAAL